MGSFWKASFFVLILVVAVKSDRKRRQDEGPPAENNEVAPEDHPDPPEAAAGDPDAAAAAAVGPPKVESTTPMDWIELAIKKHNEYRALHHVSPLVYNKSLCEISQAYANHIAVTFKVIHNPELQSAKLGENLYYSSSSDPIDLSADKPVTAWYNEIHDYDYKTGFAVNEQEILHFTQLVWKGTTDVGISYSKAVKPDGTHAAYVVANYYPRGNFDDFEENVLPPDTNDAAPVPPAVEDTKQNKTEEEKQEDKADAPTSGVLKNGTMLVLIVAGILSGILSYYYTN